MITSRLDGCHSDKFSHNTITVPYDNKWMVDLTYLTHDMALRVYFHTFGMSTHGLPPWCPMSIFCLPQFFSKVHFNTQMCTNYIILQWNFLEFQTPYKCAYFTNPVYCYWACQMVWSPLTIWHLERNGEIVTITAWTASQIYHPLKLC